MPVLDRPHVAPSASLLTWNVNRRTTLLEEQADRVLLGLPDVVCLQEVTPTALPRWTARLEADGYNVEPSGSAADDPPGRRLGVLIASRSALTRVAQPIGVPWAERLLIADVQLPGWSQPLRVVCLHAPTRDDPEQAKIQTFKAVSKSLAALSDELPVVLCGDLNAPQGEAPGGRITTFGQTPRGTLRRRLGKQEDLAERSILRRPGWSDAFRALHDYDVCGRSWQASRGTHLGYRLDHILLSPHLTSTECEYDHDVRNKSVERKSLSDHSAMFATFELSLPAVASSS